MNPLVDVELGGSKRLRGLRMSWFVTVALVSLNAKKAQPTFHLSAEVFYHAFTSELFALMVSVLCSLLAVRREYSLLRVLA